MEHRYTNIRVEELCCAEEERVIRRSLSALDGVREISVDILNQTVKVGHVCPDSSLASAIRDAGFTPRFAYDDDDGRTFWRRYRDHLSTAAGAVLLLTGFSIQWAGVPAPAAEIALTLSIVAGGWRIIQRGINAARRLTPDMNLLMTIAAAGAVAIGRVGEGAAVMVLFSVAHLLELQSLSSSRRAIRSLMSDSPSLASVRRNGGIVDVRVEEVGVGECVVVRPGEAIPLDGRIVSGKSAVNQSMITGEAVPVAKREGDTVFAGSLNGSGLLEIEITSPAGDSTIARIIRMVEQAQSRRAVIHRFADRFAYYYTPAVLAGAVLMAVVPPIITGAPFGEWFYRALVMLVIACPCALVISTPVTIVSGLTLAARKGVLIKGGLYLEGIGSVRAIAFDKTGTLTRGLPRVSDIIPLGGHDRRRVLETAALADSLSEHHFASAILEKAGSEGVDVGGTVPEHFETIPGRGVRAVLGGEDLFIGNHAFVEEEGLCSAELETVLASLEADGKSVVVAGRNGIVEGVLGIRDELRPETASVVAELRRSGITKTVMITGDNARTANAIAVEAGIDEVHAEVLPGRKSEIVEEIKRSSGPVAMVGDGVNDAPAIASASVGIAMGGTGTDVALETADIVLMSDDLTKLPLLRAISRRTLRIVRQNIAIALGTKMVFMTLGAMGEASLWTAVLADDGAALLVILNGLRALRWKGGAAPDGPDL